MKRKTIGILAAVLGIVFLGLAGLLYYMQTSAFMETAGQTAASTASEMLGVRIDVGSIEVKSLRTLEVHDVAVYDKQAEIIARADKAQVTYRLLSALSAPAEAVKEVTVSDVEAVIAQRDDGSWNFEDLISKTPGGQKFHGMVRVENGRVIGRMQGKELTLEKVNGSLDMADYPVMKAEVSGENQGTQVEASGTFDEDRQIVNAKINNMDLGSYLGLVPDGLIPQDVSITGGKVETAQIHAFRNGGKLSFTGDADFADGAVHIMETDVTGIKGHAAFTDAEALVSVEADADGQHAKAHGKIRFDTGAPYLDLTASSESFDPSRILKNLPYQGAASFDVKVRGTFKNPSIEGQVKVAEGSAMDIPFQNLSAKVRYQDQNVFVKDMRVQVFGGKAEGEAAIAADNLSYTAHVKATGIDMGLLSEIVPQASVVTGKATADVGISGVGTSLEQLQAYGSAKLENGTYGALPIENINTSFYLAGDNLQLDFLSINLPNHSRLAAEGTITGLLTSPKLDLTYYGAHFDLSLLQKVEPNADVTGLSDFKGTVQGDLANPQVAVKFSGLKGTLFKQPFDSLKLKASGSLDGVNIDDFLMEKDGKEVWRVAGSIGFTGERKLNLQIDTMGARMEDIAALVAPDQPITGNVDNIIKFTGTLDNPKGVGYIHFYRGSYRGVLLSGMDGDYFLEDGVVRLQDFHAYSPMVDMILNGTIDQNRNLSMKVEAKDIDLKRIEHKLPYEVSGHGTFKGYIKGNVDRPEFYGLLDAPDIVLNAQEIKNLHGMVKYRNGNVDIDQFGFEQNGGTYDAVASINTETKAITGEVVVQNADVNAITALLNQKNDLVQGRLNCSATLAGNVDNPQVAVYGSMPKGTVGGYDVHDVDIDIQLADQVVAVKKIEGKQGSNGLFSLSGTAGLAAEQPLQGKLSASDLEMGMFAKAAGIQANVIGTADIEATFGGVVPNPSADVTISGHNGGVQGSTFDNLNGVFHLKNGLITVDTLTVQKVTGVKTYQASAKGIIPSRALFADKNEQLDDIEQIQLTVSLDQADLSLLPTVSKQVDWAVGATTGNLKIHGTLAHPLVDGTVGLTNGAVKWKMLEKPMTDMNAKITFAGSKVTVQDFSGKMGEGTYSLTGFVLLDGVSPDKYDFTLKADKLDIQSDLFRGPITGEIHVFDTDFYGRHMPKISGTVDFQNCMVSVPAIPDGDSDLPDAVLDVQVNVGDKVHFYSSYLYDLYLGGQFHIGGIVSHPKMSGSLQVKRGGTINYLKTEFKIREGLATFDQVASFLPSIDFFADTRLTQAKVFLSAKGPLDKMEIKLTSSPEMSQTQIIQLLTLRDAYKNGQKNMNAGDMLSVGIQMSFLSEVEDILRDFLFLDQFTISRGSGSIYDRHDLENETNKYDFNVQMGKYISDRVMVKYTRSLGGQNVNRYGLQYDFNDKLGLTFDREGSGYIVGLEARMSF
ncbi:translocation/assembly module TamB domain-containing protein [Selenomonas sp.]|uniref:translocation/assembly module TamB domain-containing protein n=1 Tax=Selenomonas sp. TaxID=2053611 RepID=UPI0025D3E7D1|nr:translocation/assembly module TamB domain-containing protein [Selenomonas sp.]